MPIEFKHIEMVGRLAKDEEIKGFEDYGRTAVFINWASSSQIIAASSIHISRLNRLIAAL